MPRRFSRAKVARGGPLRRPPQRLMSRLPSQAALARACPSLVVVAAPRRHRRPEPRRRHRGSRRKLFDSTGMNSVVMMMCSPVALVPFVATWFLVNSLLLPVEVLLPGLLTMMGLPGMKGIARRSYHTELYLGSRRVLVLGFQSTCRRPPPLPLARRRDAPTRLAVLLPFSASQSSAPRGRVALFPRQFFAGRHATSAEEPPEVGAGAATIRYAWPAPKTAARARTPSARGVLAAAMIVRLMINIMFVVPRLPPSGPMRSVANVVALARAASRLPAAGRMVACVCRPRRTVETMVTIMSRRGPRPLAVLAPTARLLARSRPSSMSPSRAVAATKAMAQASRQLPAAPRMLACGPRPRRMVEMTMVL